MALLSKLVEAGVDWLTLSSKESSRWAEWKECFQASATIEQRAGHKWTDAHRLGYVGQQCGGMFLGERNREYLLMLSSRCANEYGVLFSPEAVHCTRIDMQVTVELATQDKQLLAKLYDSVKAWHPQGHRPPKYGLLQDTEEGGTLYVGSRQSMLFGRIYDKGVESRTAPAGKLFRFELEVKAEFADQAVALVYGSEGADRACAWYVKDFFEKRHIPCPWGSEHFDEVFRASPHSQDDVQGIRWLGGPVATVIERLIGTVGIEPVILALFGKSWHNIDVDSVTLLLEQNVAV